MLRGRHAAYEALAGAIALGEASDAERAAFSAHCATCARCADDADALRTDVVTVVAVARELETWRPQVRDGVVRRIDADRGRSTGRTTTLLTAAIALSLVLNAAFATGFAQRAGHAIEPVIARVLPFPPLVASEDNAAQSAPRDAETTR
jgi:anti-sigma factor RsiW